MNGSEHGAPGASRPPRACPICGKRATEESYPFCSRRCADVDLNRWLSGNYVIAGERTPNRPAESEDE
jgi:endogenous inhibitor of DNA gyrase (YacG/DUF329 family)